jgi:hypothetical protein
MIVRLIRKAKKELWYIKQLCSDYFAYLKLDVEVGEKPHLESETIDFLDSTITKGSIVLEYGAGASTVYLTSKSATVFSAESSLVWALSTTRKLRGLNLGTNSVVRYCSLGYTGSWGFPLEPDQSNHTKRRNLNYVCWPWTRLEGELVKPVLILIDGRFRNACVAYSLYKKIKLSLDVQILLDDHPRDQYAILGNYCDFVKIGSRACLIESKQGVTERMLLKLFHDQLGEAW